MLTVFFWGMISIVFAQEKPDLSDLDQAQLYLQKNETKKALKELEFDEANLACPKRIVNKDVLASIWVYRGYAYSLQNKGDQAILDAWDQAFAMNVDIQFNEDILAKSEEESESVLNYFEARRRMVQGFGEVDLQVPENVGMAKLYIDGRPVVSGEVVLPGKHLAQIVCPEDSLQSKWSTFEQEFDWFSLCPSGVDIAQQTAEEDPFAGISGGLEVIDDIYNPNPICHEFESSEPSSFSLTSAKGKSVLLLSSGGLMLASGTATYYGLAVPRFAAVEEARKNPENLTEAEAKELTKDFNRARLLTLGMLGTGFALSGIGGYSMLQVMPNWVGISLPF